MAGCGESGFAPFVLALVWDLLFGEVPAIEGIRVLYE